MTIFDEYIKGGNPSQKEKSYAWKTAIGLQDVDGLKPSEYLVQTATTSRHPTVMTWKTTVYLERFFRSMLLGEEHSFLNRELHIEWKGGLRCKTLCLLPVPWPMGPRKEGTAAPQEKEYLIINYLRFLLCLMVPVNRELAT